MSDNTPHDDFADLEALWQTTNEPVSPRLATRWTNRMRVELAAERQREPSWFGWAVAASIVLGLHLNLAVSSSAPAWNGTEQLDLAAFEAAARERNHWIAQLEAAPSKPAPLVTRDAAH